MERIHDVRLRGLRQHNRSAPDGRRPPAAALVSPVVRRRVGTVFAALALALPVAASATVLRVDRRNLSGIENGASWDTAFSRIQPAIEAAQDAGGGEVWVAAGRYDEYRGSYPHGNVGDPAWVTGSLVLRQGVHLFGGFAGHESNRSERDWDANPTTIDGATARGGGEPAHHVVVARNIPAGQATVDGFVITGGDSSVDFIWYDDPRRHGAGLWFEAAAPVVANCRIVGNVAATFAAGAFLNSSAVQFSCCTFAENRAKWGPGGGLAAVWCVPTLTECLFDGNTVEDGDGGGIFLENEAGATLAACVFTGNRAHSGGALALRDGVVVQGTRLRFSGNSARVGGAVLVESGTLDLDNSLLLGNVGGEAGGAVALVAADASLRNCTLVANVASEGAALHLDASSPTVANTLIAGNTSGIFLTGGGAPLLRHNCVHGNTAYNFAGMDDPTGSGGNVSVPPGFANAPYGDWRLQADAVCVDAGSNAEALGSLDLAGVPRILPENGTVDIGAYESDGTVLPGGPPSVVRVAPDGDDADDGGDWNQAKRTVQAAIDEAVAHGGGEVWAREGNYPERIALPPFVYLYGGFAGGETSAQQRDWANRPTQLDGGGAGSVVVADTIGYLLAGLDGFRVVNGNSATHGGGLMLTQASPRIANCVFFGNQAQDRGGALYAAASCPAISNSTFSGNQAGYGGGLALASDSHATLSHSTVDNNTARISGGGLHASQSSPRLADCTLSGNRAQTANGGGLSAMAARPAVTRCRFFDNHCGMHGGAVALTSSAGLLVECVFLGNAAGDQGGGIYVSGSLTGNTTSFANCLIAANSAGTGGGGVHIVQTAATLVNCTVVANQNSGDGGGLRVDTASPRIVNTLIADCSAGVFSEGGGEPVFRHCCVYGNAAYAFRGMPDPTGNDGNLAAAPAFVNPAFGDWRLRGDSCCVDAGDDAAALGGEDVAGNPRVQPAEGIVDIGAYESDGTVPPLEPPARVRVSPEGTDANDGNSWEQPKRTVQAAIDAAAAAGGGEVWVRGGTYPERLMLRRFVNLYGGLAGNETALGQRDGRAAASVLDGQAGGSVVVATNLGYRTVRMDGFSVTNGAAERGGGILLEYASPVMTNCTVFGNTASFSGGGINAYFSAPHLHACTVRDNRANSSGGGVALERHAPATLEASTLSRNRANSGGGLHIDYRSDARIVNCVLANNVALGLGMHGGGGVAIADANPILVNCTITGNALSLFSTGKGGGVDMFFAAPRLLNTIVAFNSSGIARSEHAAAPFPELRHNCVAANSGMFGPVDNYAGLPDPTGTDGNISANPDFLVTPVPAVEMLPGQPAFGTLGDLRLRPESPCRNTGLAAVAPLDDMRGVVRPQETGVDTGAFEMLSGEGAASSGALRVTLEPAAAIQAGARWQLEGESDWRESGAIASGLAPGEVTVLFKPIMAWNTPAPRTVTLIADTTASLSVAYWPVTYTLTYGAAEGGGIEGNSPQAVAHGADGTPVRAVPDGSSRFVRWSDGVTDNPRHDTAVTSDLAVIAEFAPKGVPTVTWAAPAPIVYGTLLSAVQLAATADTPGEFVYTPPAGTRLDAGDGQPLHVVFHPADTVNWTPATAAAVNIDVWKATLTVMADDTSRVYGTPNPAFTLAYDGFAAGDGVNRLDATPTASCTAGADSGTGEYAITPGGGEDSNYGFLYVNGTLTIVKADQSVDLAAPPAKTYGDAPFALFATASSGLPVALASANPAVATVAAARGEWTVTIHGAGETTLAATQPGDSNWNAAAAVACVLTVARAALTVRAEDKTRPYGQENPALTWTATGYVAGEDGSVLAGVPELTCVATPASSVAGGPYPIVVSQGTLASAHYSFELVNGALTVTSASPTLAWPAPEAIVYGTPLLAAQLNAEAAPPGTFVYDPPTGTVLPVGTHTVRAAFTPDDVANWASAEATVELMVTAAPLSIAAHDRAKTYGDAVLFNGTEFTVVGLIGMDTVTAVTLASAGAAAGAAVAGSPYPIVASAAVGTGLSNYTIEYVNGALAVDPAPLTCRADDTTRSEGTPNPPLTITYTGLRNADAHPANPPAIACAATAASGVGAYPVTLTGGSDPNYVLTLVNGTLTVTAAVEVPPDGEYVAVFLNPSNPDGRCIWDFSGVYEVQLGGYTLHLDLQHDPKGSLTGIGRLSGAMPSGTAVDLPLGIKGTAAAKSGAVFATLTLSGKHGTANVKLRMKLALDNGRLAGAYTGTVSDTGDDRDPIRGLCALVLDPAMDGSHEMTFTLQRNAKGAITGFGTLTLPGRAPLPLLVKGKEAKGTVTLQGVGNRVMDPTAGSLKLKLTVRTFSNGTMEILTLSGTAFGQTLCWP